MNKEYGEKSICGFHLLINLEKNLKWRATISFDEWVLIVHGNVDRDGKMEIWEEVNQVRIDGYFSNNEVKNEEAICSNEDISKRHWCEKVRIHHDDDISFWASCDPYKDECDGRSTREQIMNVSHYWTSTNDGERCELSWG